MRKLIFILITLLITTEMFAEFSRNNEKEIVHDSITGLIWQDNEAVKLTLKKWTDAIRYCKELKLGGFDNWRLPSIEELQTITDYNRNNPALNNAFVNYFNLGYWSSTTSVDSIDKAWAVDTMNGSAHNYYKPFSRYTRCVRDIQMGTSPLALESTSSLSNDNVVKEIKHYSYPAVYDFIMARESAIRSILEEERNKRSQHIKKIAKNKSLYQNETGNISVVFVENGKKIDIESISIINPAFMDLDKVSILTRLGIDTNETSNNIILMLNDKHLQLKFDASASSLINIEIKKGQK